MSEHDTPTAAEGDTAASPPQAVPPAPGVPAAPGEDTGARIAELEDRWRRAVAELDNTGKRHRRDLERRLTEERAQVVSAWLPVVDGLEMALEHATADPDAIISGVEAVRDQALAVLSRLGFTREGEVGAVFDPARHEAVSTVRTDQVPPGTVAHVVRPGYGGADRLLRPAAVVVAAAGTGDGDRS